MNHDYIIVGSGAGGAPLASRLAQRGYRVLLLEAGGWDEPESCKVPALHPISTEHPDLSWDFFVRHYTDDELSRKDTKWTPAEEAHKQGILYPRAATVGGCTVHNAMITVVGPASDWDDLADLTGDESWSGSAMRRFFQRLERCTYQTRPKGIDRGHHGYDGWLTTSWPDVSLALKDRQLFKILKATFKAAKSAGIETPLGAVLSFFFGRIREHFDPNFGSAQRVSPEGLAIVPIAVQDGRRSGPRALLQQTLTDHPDRLTIETHALVTRVLFDRSGERPRAVGVCYRKGEKLYRADRTPRGAFEEREAHCEREVILCGGAFNTPQLLLLSGVGPAADLGQLGIDCVVDLPAVGANLQDRYEVAVIHEMPSDFSLLAQALLKEPGTAPDPAYDTWKESGGGLYASNGVLIGVFKRSQPYLREPDLFLFGLPGHFKGYEPGYSAALADRKNRFTWAILKAHTNNHGGRVRLRSADPFDPPEINFGFFADGQGRDSPDLAALLDGVRFARQIMSRVNATEVWPPPGVQGEDELRDWIRHEAWGHHACGTCRMGRRDDPRAVVDSRLRVRGTDGLRVVDASIFPTIPGVFLVTNIYMASEKAADMIHEDAHGGPDNVLYPRQLAEAEVKLIQVRRAKAGCDNADQPAADRVGLALSGGGIRSAIFNLGILQSFAKNKVLRFIDFLSTVSGGGYVGSFLGGLFSRRGQDPVHGEDGLAAAEAVLTDANSKPMRWLRKTGNFIAPNGRSNLAADIGIFLRSFLTLHFILLVFFFALYGLANLFRFGLVPWLSNQVAIHNPLPIDVTLPGPADLPLGHVLYSGLGGFWSPWVMLAEIILLAYVLPLLLAYWLASQDRPGRFQPQALLLFIAVAGVLLFVGLRQAGQVSLRPLFLILPFLFAFVAVEKAWKRANQRRRASGGTTEVILSRMARVFLTRWLGNSLACFGLVVALVLIDSVGEWVYRLAQEGADFSGTTARLGAALLALMPVLRIAAGLVGQPAKSPPSTLRRKVIGALVPALLFFGIAFFLGVVVAYLSHMAFGGGADLLRGALLTLFAIVVSLLFGTAIMLVNRTSLQAPYGSRLCRTFLGATNTQRQYDPRGGNVLEEFPDDDIALRDYRPETAGGPLHIINTMLNHTTDLYSQQVSRERQGDNFAVSPVGLSVGTDIHALWGPDGSLAPAGTPRELDHPFVGAKDTEELTVSQWVAISGAAISPGMGRETTMGRSLLLGLANLRTGYWWRSGRRSTAHPGRPPRGWWTALRERITRKFFFPQALLIYELIGRFGGPMAPYWYLSDAGNFENLGVYELLRRRVPYIIACDSGADSETRLDNLGELLLKARIDFQAEFEFFTNDEIAAHPRIPPRAKAALGELKDLKADESGVSRKHAALARVTFRDDPGNKLLFLFIKSSLTGDEPADVLNYRANHLQFPHEPTYDQFFTEQQWESYRKLGEHVGDQLLGTGRLWLMDL